MLLSTPDPVREKLAGRKATNNGELGNPKQRIQVGSAAQKKAFREIWCEYVLSIPSSGKTAYNPQPP